MSDDRGSNVLLANMPRDDLALLTPHLVPIELLRRQEMTPPNQPITDVFFLTRGIGSVVTRTMLGDMTEVGLFGCEGFAPMAPLLGADRTPLEAFIQSEAGTGYKIAIAPFLAAVDARPSLRAFLLRYVQTFVVQTAIGSTSSAHQPIEHRLARWLLMCHDREEGDVIRVTHEFIGMMIAADRSTVTLALQKLEGERLIKAERGKITVLDRAGLRALAIDGYGQAEAEYSRLIAPFGKG